MEVSQRIVPRRGDSGQGGPTRLEACGTDIKERLERVLVSACIARIKDCTELDWVQTAVTVIIGQQKLVGQRKFSRSEGSGGDRRESDERWFRCCSCSSVILILRGCRLIIRMFLLLDWRGCGRRCCAFLTHEASQLFRWR
jgi:hypothetical protein